MSERCLRHTFIILLIFVGKPTMFIFDDVWHLSFSKSASHKSLFLNICWGSPFLLAATVLVVNVRFSFFGPPWENSCCSWNITKKDRLDSTWKIFFLILRPPSTTYHHHHHLPPPPTTTSYHLLPRTTTYQHLPRKIADSIKYKRIYNIRQTTAMNKIPQ